MSRFQFLFACMLLTSSCASKSASRSSPPPAPVATSIVAWPCEHVTKATLTADCFIANPEQRGRVGALCELHHDQRLRPDTVAVSYGFISSEACGEKPGLFVNSHLAVSGGCVVGRPYTEVAYCPECRRVRKEWERAQGH